MSDDQHQAGMSLGRQNREEQSPAPATVSHAERLAPICLSIAVRAWNEEKVIRKTLESLFGQSLFEELSRRHECCEVICIPNGCTDYTAAIAETVLAEQAKSHPFRNAFLGRVAEIPTAGRNNTWNAFVHSLSWPTARFLYLMDADILFGHRETLFNMYAALLARPEAQIASDAAIKDITFRPQWSLLDRISLATTDMTGTIEGQITGQLYCIRSAVARRMWLPKDLGAPDDGFIKAIVCTDFLTRELSPRRIVKAEGASHVYEAYRSVAEVLNNQKRQMIGQTTVHVLLEYLKTLPIEQRKNLGNTLREEEERDPDWLRRLVGEHIQHARHFWGLFPGALTFRFKRWARLRGAKRITHLPAAFIGFVVTMIACVRADYHFRRGRMHYWPKASRENIGQLRLDQNKASGPQTANG